MRWVTRWAMVGVIAGAVVSCADDDSASDAGIQDAGPFPAIPDPDERTDCVTTRPAEGEVLAKHLTCEEELLSGTVAMGRLERDVLLENAVARFVVRGQDGSATFIGTGAGGLVDAAPMGGVDVLKDVLPLADLSAIGARELVVTEAGGDRAVVRAVFEMEVVGLVAEVVPIAQPVPLFGVVDYELRADDPLLRMTVRLTPMEGESSVRFSPGLAVFVGGGAEMRQPGEEGMHLMLEGPESATYVALPEDGNLSDVIASINLMQGADRREVEQGDVAEYEVRVAVGPTAAHAWNAAHADDDGLAELTVHGAAGDRVEIHRLEGDDEIVALRTRFDDEGRAQVLLPPGEYRAVAGFEGWFTGEPVDVTLPADGASVEVGPAPSGMLHVEATADATVGGDPEDDAPVRVTVMRKGGGELTRFVAIGPTEQRVPPGAYEVSLSRGPEFDLHWEGLGEDGLVVEDGATVEITEVVLPRVVDTGGWVAGDYHLHSEMSTDSRHWLPSALRMLAAEGLEVAAATDHDFTTDYDKYVAQAETGGWVLMVPGSEVSHPILAHINGFPLVVDEHAHIQGSPPWFGGAPADWFDALRERGDLALDPQGPIVQINHPRRSSSAWFRSINLDRDTGQAQVSPTDLGLDPATDLNDFSVDAIEVWNRHPTSAGGANEESLLDYLALYGYHGHRFAMMGNSDSHSAGNPAGSTRTYVRVPDDTRGAFDWEDVAEGIRNMDVTVSAGIFVTAEVAGDPVDGQVPLHVRVQAPPWIEVHDTMRIYVGPDPEDAMEVSLVPEDEVVRHDGIEDVPADAGFVVVRVDGEQAPPVMSHSTLGITNPIDIP